MKDVVGGLVSFQFAAGPIVPYIPQLLSLKSGKAADGFSPTVSLVLLLANTLRVAFWFPKRFETPLLVQSVLLIGMQMALLQALASNKLSMARKDGRELRLSPLNDFWAWDSFTLYLAATALWCAALALISSKMYRFDWYVEGLGAAAVSCESVMGLPQLMRNYKRKSTAGISVLMVMGWVGGDFLKVAYFLARSVPTVFMYGALVQMALDLSVAFQIFVLYPNDDVKTVLRRFGFYGGSSGSSGGGKGGGGGGKAAGGKLRGGGSAAGTGAGEVGAAAGGHRRHRFGTPHSLEEQDK